MEVKRSGSEASTKGPSDWFTGTVRIDPLFQTPDPARVAGASVTFEPGARTAWHTHPLGQTLIVTAGCEERSERAGPPKKSDPVMLFGFHPVRTLAWCNTNNRYDAYCHSRKARWESRRLVGESYRRALQKIIGRMSAIGTKRTYKLRRTCPLSGVKRTSHRLVEKHNCLQMFPLAENKAPRAED